MALPANRVPREAILLCATGALCILSEPTSLSGLTLVASVCKRFPVCAEFAVSGFISCLPGMEIRLPRKMLFARAAWVTLCAAIARILICVSGKSVLLIHNILLNWMGDRHRSRCISRCTLWRSPKCRDPVLRRIRTCGRLNGTHSFAFGSQPASRMMGI